ncbi:MarR family transcriptional regulator [Actinophytocola sp.]|uniref:MarR family winged helix-turn-helix transcriptional regulator n=1 Tax=Actinophytocola sp. TaxID=1872138 RepID=UPI0025B94D13|nr:MarR family transcriptional regulator [Actinophytocola sp.]
MGPTEPTTGFLIWRLSTRWRADVDRALAPLGLTHAQFSVLAALSGLARSGQRPNQRQLADFTGLEPLYVSKLARALESAGLVERPADPADPRAVRLVLTDRGRAVVAEAVDIVHARHAELTAAIGGPDGTLGHALRATLHSLLDSEPDESEQTMTRPRVFNGQDINVAAAATRGILDTLLTEADLSFEQFIALRAMAAEPAGREAIGARASGPAADQASVLRAITALEAAGLATGSADRVEPTERGRQLVERVAAASLRVGDQLFEGIPADDQVVAKRVLDLITERARALRAELSGQAL